MLPSTYSTHHYQFINNVFGRFIAGLADFCKKDLIPRSKDAIISTYDKSIEHFRNRKNFVGEKWSPEYPFLIIDPQMDFEPDAQAGRFLHGYPSFMDKFAQRMYGPVIYEDRNIKMAPVLNRYKGSIDIHIYCGSVAEMIDERFHIIQSFGGYGRPIYPFKFESIIVIPEEYKTYEYSNPYTDETYTLDWDSTENKAETLLLRNINKNELCFPVYIAPWLTLTGVSDAADKYGGSGDIIGVHRLIASIEWEASIPTHIVFSANYVPIPAIPMEFTIPTKFQTVKNQVSKETMMIADKMDSIADFGDVSGHPEKLDLTFDHALNYTITSSDASTLSDVSGKIEIQLDETLQDERFIRIMWQGNFLDRDIIWRLKASDHSKVEMLGVEASNFIEADNNLTILIYREETYT